MRLRTPTAILQSLQIVKTYMRDFTKMDRVCRGYFKKGKEPAMAMIQAPLPIECIDIDVTTRLPRLRLNIF